MSIYHVSEHQTTKDILISLRRILQIDGVFPQSLITSFREEQSQLCLLR